MIIAFLGTTRSLVNERKFKSEYLERQIFERLLKLSESKSDLSKLSTLSEPSIVKFIENQSEHFSKLTLYHLKKRATRRSRRAREPSRIPLHLSRCPNFLLEKPLRLRLKNY